MENEKIILDAFKTNKIDKILLIDDAYDPPVIDGILSGKLLDFLMEEEGVKFCRELDLNDLDRKSAIEALNTNSLQDDYLIKVNKVLFDAFVSKQLDPKNKLVQYFEGNKGIALSALTPLYELLKKCSAKVIVRTAGIEDGVEQYLDFKPQVLFIDYYLSPDIQPFGSPSKEEKNAARLASVELLKQLIQNFENAVDIPAIVLMSSKNVAKEADDYRHHTGRNQILSLRFGFLNKYQVTQDGSKFEITQDAVDVLLDISQGYLFGRELQQMIGEWNSGATTAIEIFTKMIADLHVKEFAYLMRFRLQDEGQPLSDYLDWFFGEYLKGLISQKVDWRNSSFSNLESKPELTKSMQSIEGAFDGPSEQIARIYHRIKVGDRRLGKSEEYRFGDIYMSSDVKSVRAVITPDCDLVLRKGKRKVNEILTIGGTLTKFDGRNSAIDDFFLYNDTAYNLKWKQKDLRTYPTECEESLEIKENLKLVGTLCPLYAYAMQRRALEDLGRIGLPVAPALGLNAIVKVWIRKNDASDPFEQITIKTVNTATIIPARTRQEGSHLVVFRRAFVNELVKHLIEYEECKICRRDLNNLENLKKDPKKFRDALLVEGVSLENNGVYGIRLTLDKGPKRNPDAAWLQFTIAISTELKQELQ